MCLDYAYSIIILFANSETLCGNINFSRDAFSGGIQKCPQVNTTLPGPKYKNKLNQLISNACADWISICNNIGYCSLIGEKKLKIQL